jgi:hypothetical protein
MGVPGLIPTLEPWAEIGSLRGEHVVIDGPAFAYHVLSIFRRSQVYQPSGQLLGQVAVKWLDEIVRQGITMWVPFR